MINAGKEDRPQICARCVLDSSVPGIRFDEKGICNYCKRHDSLEKKYELNEENERKFNQLLDRIKSEGKNKKYDCVVGISGGRDSCYSLFMAKKLGLRPLAIYFDNGWHSKIAEDNIKKIVTALDIDFKSVGPEWKELREMYISFLKASVPGTCGPCFVGVLSYLYQAAIEEGIRYVIIGASFRTEGIVPFEWNYVDGKYFEHIAQKLGKIKTKNFNKTKLFNLVNYALLKRIKVIQLPLYIEYGHERIARVLEKEFNWVDGGGHHFDCLYKPLAVYIRNKKFNVDPRKIQYSALVRSKEMTRKSALESLNKNPIVKDKEGIEYCLKQLRITHKELDNIMSSEPKNFLDYPNYFSFIKKIKYPIKLLCKLKLIPEISYEKYFES